MKKQQNIETAFFLVVFTGLIYLTYILFSPFLVALFLALVLVVVFSPAHTKILKLLKGHRPLSALLSVVIVVFAIMVPFSVIITLLFQEAISLYENIAQGGGALVFADKHLDILEGYVNNIAPALSLDFNIQSHVEVILEWFISNINTFLSGIVGFVLSFFIMLFAIYFLFKDGVFLRKKIVELSPFSDEYDEKILKQLEIAVNSGMKSQLAIAAIQGTLTGIGFLIFGISNPVLWGFVAAFAALIPAVGTGIVIIPTGIYLLIIGQVISGAGIIIWGVLIVGLVDNLLRPILLEKGINIHSFILLLSIFGGLILFGPIGVIAGPIVIAFLFSLLEIYPQIMKQHKID